MNGFRANKSSVTIVPQLIGPSGQMVPNQFGSSGQMVLGIIRFSGGHAVGMRKYGNKIGWGPFVEGDQIFGDHLSMGTEFYGDCLSRGINFMGIVCPGKGSRGPEVRGSNGFGTKCVAAYKSTLSSFLNFSRIELKVKFKTAILGSILMCLLFYALTEQINTNYSNLSIIFLLSKN